MVILGGSGMVSILNIEYGNILQFRTLYSNVFCLNFAF